MTAGKNSTPDAAPFKVNITRQATVTGVSGKPALELEVSDGQVKVTPLPKNGGQRDKVKLSVLRDAINALSDAAA